MNEPAHPAKTNHRHGARFWTSLFGLGLVVVLTVITVVSYTIEAIA